MVTHGNGNSHPTNGHSSRRPERPASGRPSQADTCSCAKRTAVGLCSKSLEGLEMRRREFVAGLGGTAAWSVAARAQRADRMRRIGVMLGTLPADDPETQARVTAFVQGLQERGWIDGRNVRIELRFGLNDPERLRKYRGRARRTRPGRDPRGFRKLALVSLQEASRAIPIVFTNVTDPVGEGVVGSLARPGGNATGFMSTEFSFAGKMAGVAQADRAAGDTSCRPAPPPGLPRRPVRCDPGGGTDTSGWR